LLEIDLNEVREVNQDVLLTGLESGAGGEHDKLLLRVHNHHGLVERDSGGEGQVAGGVDHLTPDCASHHPVAGQPGIPVHPVVVVVHHVLVHCRILCQRRARR